MNNLIPWWIYFAVGTAFGLSVGLSFGMVLIWWATKETADEKIARAMVRAYRIRSKETGILTGVPPDPKLARCNSTNTESSTRSDHCSSPGSDPGNPRSG